MQGPNVSDSSRRPWYVTRIPTLPEEERLPRAAAGEDRIWALYWQLKLELCAVLRRLQETTDGCRVLGQVLAETPELPLMTYLDEEIHKYMAVESAIDAEDGASASTIEDEPVAERTENSTDLVQNGC
ncbi:hypothetical protein RHGRI_007626 [Rhododendron griersonianum]|uniref:Uncharacterized protein n=1 Tax=Rhododendron griersonianum TaxID=479676 RepID=A0AAV6L0G3_9ERIC|nr:hypothetical protein RHGRI_007626 [Rhododendron griersonianum]